MIANCKQARHGEEIGDYNKEKKGEWGACGHRDFSEQCLWH